MTDNISETQTCAQCGHLLPVTTKWLSPGLTVTFLDDQVSQLLSILETSASYCDQIMLFFQTNRLKISARSPTRMCYLMYQVDCRTPQIEQVDPISIKIRSLQPILKHLTKTTRSLTLNLESSVLRMTTGGHLVMTIQIPWVVVDPIDQFDVNDSRISFTHQFYTCSEACELIKSWYLPLTHMTLKVKEDNPSLLELSWANNHIITTSITTCVYPLVKIPMTLSFKREYKLECLPLPTHIYQPSDRVVWSLGPDGLLKVEFSQRLTLWISPWE